MHVTSEFHGLRRAFEALKITRAEWKANGLAFAEPEGGNILFLSNLRKRIDHGDEPTDPPPATAAARPYEHTFVQAVAASEAGAA